MKLIVPMEGQTLGPYRFCHQPGAFIIPIYSTTAAVSPGRSQAAQFANFGPMIFISLRHIQPSRSLEHGIELSSPALCACLNHLAQ